MTCRKGRLALPLAIAALVTSAPQTSMGAEFSFPGLSPALKKQAEDRAAYCDGLSTDKKSQCFVDAFQGIAGDGEYFFYKSLRNLPGDARTTGWSRCKALATNDSYDYVERALACQNVVAHYFRERVTAGQPVSWADLHGSNLMLEFSARVAQLSIIAKACASALSGCGKELSEGLVALPDLSQLGDLTVMPHDPDLPPSPPPQKKPAKLTPKETKKVVETVAQAQKSVTSPPKERDCPTETTAGPSGQSGWSFNPFVERPAGDGSKTIDLSKPRFSLDYDFYGNGKPGGHVPGPREADKKPGNGFSTVNPRDPVGLGQALDALEQRRGTAVTRLPGAVSAVRDAASSPDAPDRGSAIFTLLTDANGKVVDVKVQSSDAQAWSKIIPEIKSSLSRISGRVKEGSRGLAITVRVDVDYLNPSGTKEGHKVKGPELDLQHTTIKVATFDLSDIGAGASRQVHTRQIDEQSLY